MSARIVARRAAVALAGIVLVGIAAGAATEATLRARAARTVPPAGRMVDVGGHRLQLDCRGAGSPTVVLESGLDHLGALSWASVHDSLALGGRVCAYSRAGVLWSDASPASFDAQRAARDLHAALARAGERPPYVMVGHSIGGPYVLLFTAHYPRDVSGVVLVDATHPLQFPRLDAALGRPVMPSAAVLSAAAMVAPALARAGVMRLLPDGDDAAWPAAVRTTAGAWHARSMAALLEETASIAATLAAARPATRLGDRPLMVLTAGESPSNSGDATLTPAQRARLRAAWRALQDDEATWSTDSRHEVVEGGAHHIQLDRPAVVIRAVRDVVRRVRTQPLRSSSLARAAVP